MSDHQHVFHLATVLDIDGKPYADGRRCSCGMEVVGSGPMALNAQFLRASQSMNRSLAECAAEMGRAFAAANRRRFPN